MASLPVLQQYRVFLEGWDIWLTVIVTEKGMYFVLWELCGALGIADARQQYQQLKAHESSAPFAEKLPVKLAYGRRTTYCIHHEILGGWLFMVNPNLLRPEFRSRLVDFQQKARRALNRIIFGEVDSTLVMTDNSSHKAPITYLSDWMGRPKEPIQLSPPEDEKVQDNGDEDESDTTHSITGSLPVGPCPNCHTSLKVILTENGNYLQEESA